VSHELLLNAHRGSDFVEPSPIPVTKHMPAYRSVDTCSLRSRFEYPFCAGIGNRRVCWSAGWGRPSRQPSRGKSAAIRVQGQFVLGTFGLQFCDLTPSVPFPYLHNESFEVDRAPAEPQDFADTKSGASSQKNHGTILSYEVCIRVTGRTDLLAMAWSSHPSMQGPPKDCDAIAEVALESSANLSRQLARRLPIGRGYLGERA
jgi:hypothetical protein